MHTLSEIVTLAFKGAATRTAPSRWDAWKDEDGFWVAQLQWQAGRTTNTAHWRYQPDAHGGTITALDDTAAQLVDPDFGSARSRSGAHQPDLRSGRFRAGSRTRERRAVRQGPGFSIVLADNESHAPASEVTGEIEHDQPKVAPQQTPGKDKRGKPALPSWDDVLLGVRSNGRG